MTRPLLVASLSLAAFAAVAAVAAVAHAQPPEGLSRQEGPPRGPGGPGGPRFQLFISPAGEPFRDGQDAPYPVAAWFARADADKDGRLDRKEFIADAMVFFGALDADDDGLISPLENTTYENKVAPEILPTAPHPGLGGPPPRGGKRKGGPRPGDNKLKSRRALAGIGMQGAAPYSLLNEPQPVRGADLDFNFRITRAEFESTASKRFTILDTDGDGALLLDGLPRTPVQQIRENMSSSRHK